MQDLKQPLQAIKPLEQAVFLYLDERNQPANIFSNSDLTELEDRLSEVIENLGLGEFDGDEIGLGEVTLFMYGPDAERLFAGILDTLLSSPLCRGARVVIRYGKPGASEREVQL